MISDEQIQDLRARFVRIGVVRFEGHVFVLQQPNKQHALDWRRANADPKTMIESNDMLVQQIICAFDDIIAPDPKDRAPLRQAFNAWLADRPAACDNMHFSPVLAELLGQQEEGNAERAGKGCSVLSRTQKTSD